MTQTTLTLTNTDETDAERRRHPRLAYVRPCKLQRTGDVRYQAGETCNISAGGALVRIGSGTPVRHGETIRIAVAFSNKGVLDSGSMLPGRVVRVTPIDRHHQAVALQYATPAADAGDSTAAKAA